MASVAGGLLGKTSGGRAACRGTGAAFAGSAGDGSRSSAGGVEAASGRKTEKNWASASGVVGARGLEASGHEKASQRSIEHIM